LVALSFLSLGAGYRTQYFLVTAPTPELAREIGDAAEACRRDLALEWLGRELPPWRDICTISARVSPNLGAGGATTFMFDNGQPFGWKMTLQGSRERILDSVLPHEITHTIFATHFGRPLPRWADEGACTTVEHPTEKNKQHHLLITFLTSGRGIAFNEMFAMREYPADILPLYSQGYSLARFLIAQGGKRKYIAYVGDGMHWHNWTAATKKHYGYDSLSHLQITWLDWVRRGSPALPASSPETALAAYDQAIPAKSAAGIASAGPTPATTPSASAADPTASVVAPPPPGNLAATAPARDVAPTASDAESGFILVSATNSWYARQHARSDSAAEEQTALEPDAATIPLAGTPNFAGPSPSRSNSAPAPQDSAPPSPMAIAIPAPSPSADSASAPAAHVAGWDSYPLPGPAARY
jgi:hypothetical protein